VRIFNDLSIHIIKKNVNGKSTKQNIIIELNNIGGQPRFTEKLKLNLNIKNKIKNKTQSQS
jgi:hypothetical protein